jgi:phosphoglycolate phosphatase
MVKALSFFKRRAFILAHLLASEQIPRQRAVMIGDRAGDVVSARANDIRSIGVLWGYGSESELAGAGADVVCRSPAELPTCLAGFRA